MPTFERLSEDMAQVRGEKFAAAERMECRRLDNLADSDDPADRAALEAELHGRNLEAPESPPTRVAGPTIPPDVLAKILAHRPHLAAVARNIRVAPQQCEKALADAYLMGETRLTVEETWKLAACSAGRGYGERVASPPRGRKSGR